MRRVGLPITIAVLLLGSVVLARTSIPAPATRGELAMSPAAVESIASVVSVEREHYYSPFLITSDSDTVFKTISFTDVGISQPMPGPVDTTLLETIAESLAKHLAASEQLHFTPQVHYDPALVDPQNHLFCEEHHLYVAVWRGFAPDRWGYSLWSGCNEEHQFAWKEVVMPPKAEGDDLISSVTPLTESIVESLSEATRKSCYLAKC
ncbi:MAG: hypothetical protein H0U74_10045 [Bradymonadaceae bacterium]|nr:hypothetical protein [Lujinxingiaceae bacterium]